MEENNVKMKVDERIYLCLGEKETEQDYCNEIKSVKRVIELIDAKNKKQSIEELQKFDICKEMMYVVAQDCIKKLEISEKLEDLIKDKKSDIFEEYPKECVKQNIREEKLRERWIAFLWLYIDYSESLELNNIMKKRAIEEFGVKRFPYDPDVALVSLYIYCKLFQKKYSFMGFDIKKYETYKYEICCRDEKNIKYIKYRGDTMTSWWTSIKAYLKIGKKRENYFKSKENCQQFCELGEDAVKEFMDAVYTIGNFCPVPIGFNIARSSGGDYDYWDLTLMKIRDWYISVDSKSLYERDKLIYEDLLNNTGNSLACLRWLESFGQGQMGWHNFVDTLYMQDFVYNVEKKVIKDYQNEKGNKEYYDVIRFWDGHEWDKGKVKKTFPKDDKEQVEAFKKMTKMIRARSERIAKALTGIEKG